MKTWTKVVGGMAAAAVFVTGFAGVAMAQGPSGNQADQDALPYERMGAGHGYGFVDEDGDGVCDNFVDEDGDGVCDNALHDGTGYGHGYGDCDGSCDGTQPAPQDGTGSQHGPGRGW